jgi:hypothetical protein
LLETELVGKDRTELVFPSRRGGYLMLGEIRWVFDSALQNVRESTTT